MGNSDFYVDTNIEVDGIGDEFVQEADRRLREMAQGHKDIVGAAVALEKVVKAETAFLYEVRIVLYKKPQYLRASEQHAEPIVALRTALEALEGQVLKSREKQRENSIPRSETTNTVVYELSAQEVYATYAKGIKPAEFLERDRTEIASQLMLEEGLSEEAAYFAADQMMRVAVENTENRE
jgi:ribosome-associated translation inhibitor RaiA